MIDDALQNTPESAARLAAVQRGLEEKASPSVLVPGDDRNPVDNERKSMETLFAALEERGVSKPWELSEYQVYSRLDYYQKQGKPRE